MATSPVEKENGLTVPGKAVNIPIVPNTLKGGRPGQVSPRGTKDGGTSPRGSSSNYRNHYSSKSSKASTSKPRLGSGSQLAIQHSTPSENCTTIEGDNTGTSSGGSVNTESSPGDVNSWLQTCPPSPTYSTPPYLEKAVTSKTPLKPEGLAAPDAEAEPERPEPGPERPKNTVGTLALEPKLLNLNTDLDSESEFLKLELKPKQRQPIGLENHATITVASLLQGAITLVKQAQALKPAFTAELQCLQAALNHHWATITTTTTTKATYAEALANGLPKPKVKPDNTGKQHNKKKPKKPTQRKARKVVVQLDGTHFSKENPLDTKNYKGPD